MKENSLLYFDSPKELREFIKSLDIYQGWQIKDGLLNERGKQIEGRRYTKVLRELFKSKNFFRRNVSLAEIVSWLDNLVLISRLLDKLEKEVDREIFNCIQISVEYMIELSKKMRIDFVFIYEGRILLLEMRTVSKFEKLRSTWEKKFHELLVYKELMSYYIEKRIILYALISLYEYEKKWSKAKHIDHNCKQLDYLILFMKTYLFV